MNAPWAVWTLADWTFNAAKAITCGWICAVCLCRTLAMTFATTRVIVIASYWLIATGAGGLALDIASPHWIHRIELLFFLLGVSLLKVASLPRWRFGVPTDLLKR